MKIGGYQAEIGMRTAVRSARNMQHQRLPVNLGTVARPITSNLAGLLPKRVTKFSL